LQVIAVGLLWGICAWRSLQFVHVLHVFAATTGLTWGIVISLSVANFIENSDEVSGWLPTMIHGALVMPVITTVTVLPFWYFRKRRDDWSAKHMGHCLKIAIITPLVLIGVYTATFSCYWFLSPSDVTVWQGRKAREVSFRTSIPVYWRPAFWFVERACRYENYQFAGGIYYNIYVFTKFLDSPNKP
jgi:hypothetical protein